MVINRGMNCLDGTPPNARHSVGTRFTRSASCWRWHGPFDGVEQLGVEHLGAVDALDVGLPFTFESAPFLFADVAWIGFAGYELIFCAPSNSLREVDDVI